MDKNYKFSIVVLTFNRRDRIEKLMRGLSGLKNEEIEIIIIDNCSNEPIDEIVATDSRAILIRNEANLGAVGRNSGMRVAKGEFIITLDDDISGLTDLHLDTIASKFDSDESLAALSFAQTDEISGEVTAWCHPRAPSIYASEEFPSNYFCEGGVAFRSSVLKEVGYYPETFFISHEGPDLAYRLINHGYKVVYTPDVSVIHAYEQQGRVSWRRYYFDTRNQLWLSIRNQSVSDGVRDVAISWVSLCVYSIRDGFFKYWCSGVLDAIKGARVAYAQRQAPSNEAKIQFKVLESFRPSFVSRVKNRLFKNTIRG